MTLRFLVTRASAFVPIAMSLAALGVLALALVVGVAHPPDGDEGTAAHIWQLLIAGQLPIVAYFAIIWVPRAPKQAVFVLVIQFGAALSSLLPVFVLGL